MLASPRLHEGWEAVKYGGDVRGMDAEPEPTWMYSRRAPRYFTDSHPERVRSLT